MSLSGKYLGLNIVAMYHPVGRLQYPYRLPVSSLALEEFVSPEGQVSIRVHCHSPPILIFKKVRLYDPFLPYDLLHSHLFLAKWVFSKFMA